MKRSFFSILAILLILSGCPEPGDEGLGPGSNTQPGTDDGTTQPGGDTQPGTDDGTTQPGGDTQPGTDDGTTQPEANTIVYHNIDNVFSNPNPEEYAAADLPVELSDVSAGDGLTFAGWYDNAAFEGEPLAAVAEGSAGRIDLYAKWEFRLIGSNGTQYTAAGGGIDGAEVEGANGIVYRLTQTGIDTYTAAAVGFSEALTGEVRLLDYFTFNYVTEIPVTEIGESAFRDCEITRADMSGNTNLKRIGSRAFYDCDEMTTVSLSGCTALVEIGEYAFSGFNGLKKLTTFDLTGCTALRLIGNYAFDQNAALTAIDLTPCTALETIGDFAFYLCKNVTSVDFGESVKSVGKWAFADTPMSQIEFDINNGNGGSSLEFIGGSAFSGTGLTEFDFAACPKLFEIGGSAFSRTNLTQITLYSDKDYALATIGNWAFDSCRQLTKIDLQYLDNLTTIGENAFDGCWSLTTVTLPPSLKEIGRSAFDGCSFATIDFSKLVNLEHIGAFAFGFIHELKDIDFSSCVKLTEIGDYAFDGVCFTEMHLPVSVKTIGSDAFRCANNENSASRIIYICNAETEDVTRIETLIKESEGDTAYDGTVQACTTHTTP